MASAAVSKPGFLSEKMALNDLVLATVTGTTAPQTLRAKVERVYSSRRGIRAGDLGQEIEFVRSPAHWGDAALMPGEKALLFVSSDSGRLREDPWRGHMVVEEIEGAEYAIFQHPRLWLSDDVPTLIRTQSRQDPKRPHATAIPFDVMARYLSGLVSGSDEPGIH